jgi:hypothetical protein
MSSLAIFAVDTIGFLVLFTLLAVWYWWPRLFQLAPVDALTPLLLLHVARTVGLTVLVPGVADPNLPRSFAVPAGYGDLAAAILALLTIVCLWNGLKVWPLIAWVFCVEGMGDLLNALIQGNRIDLPSFQLGATWFIFTVLVPALWVTHVMIVIILLRARRWERI